MTRLLAFAALLSAASLAQAQRMPVTTASDAARVQYTKGVHAIAHADFARSRVHFDAALAADPDFAMAHMYRAVAGSDGRAEHMRRATALGARVSEAERQQIEAYAANLDGDYDREIEILTALAERYPSDPLPMFVAAFSEYGRGDYAAAVAAARRALEADPSFAQAYNAMGYAEMAAGDEEAAERAFREQIRLAPDEANPYDSYGELLMGQGRLDEAERQFEMALSRNPAFQISRDNLTRVAVMRAYEAHQAAINSQNPDTALETYTAGVVMSPPDGSQIVGHDAVRGLLEGYYAAGRIEVGGELQEVQPLGDDAAYSRAALTVSVDGTPVERGINSYIWIKTPAGWKVARDTWTSAPVTASASN